MRGKKRRWIITNVNGVAAGGGQLDTVETDVGEGLAGEEQGLGTVVEEEIRRVDRRPLGMLTRSQLNFYKG